MPTLSIKFDPAIGPLIQIAVAPAGTYQQGKVTLFNALVDTGASRTCISKQMASKLPMIGMTQMTSATHTSVAVPLYFGDLLLPLGAVTYLGSGMQFMEFEASNAPFQALLGRDVLCSGLLTMSFDGHLSFAI